MVLFIASAAGKKNILRHQFQEKNMLKCFSLLDYLGNICAKINKLLVTLIFLAESAYTKVGACIYGKQYSNKT